MDHPFRNAAVGGFNRQDVLDYLEKTAAENTQKQQELEKQLEKQNQELEQLRRRASELEERESIFQRDRENLNRELEQTKTVLQDSRTREKAQGEELEQLRRERDSLRARVAALEPDAAAYAAVKDRTAGMELQAHCRAHAVQEQAEQQARQVRRVMEQWLRQMQGQYDQLRSQVEATVSHAADELGKAGKCLDQVNQLLGDQEVALEGIIQDYHETDPDQAPAPVPLEED